MKKTLILAFLVVAGSLFSTANAQNRKKDKQKEQPKATISIAQVPKVELKTQSDSISYAGGMSMTRGLDDYLTKRVGLTKEQMPDFLRGLKEGINLRKDSTFAPYAAGLEIATQVEKNMLPNMESQFEGSSVKIDAEKLYRGFLAALENDTTFFKQTDAEKYFQERQTTLRDERNRHNKEAGEQFLVENKKRPDVITLPDGLQYRVITKGTGAIPKSTDRVRVVYEGKTINGKVFDATAKHGTDYDTFGVSGLIKGWTEVLTMMPVGSKWEIFIPQDLAYGERGAGRDIAPYSALIFTMELKGIEEEVKATPELDVQSAPKTVSVKPATQGKKPTAKKK